MRVRCSWDCRSQSDEIQCPGTVCAFRLLSCVSMSSQTSSTTLWAASNDEQEEILIQLAIEESMRTTSVQARLSQEHKRKFDVEAVDEPQSKRSRITVNASRYAKSSTNSENDPIQMQFPDGALRLTRTSERNKDDPSFISLSDIIDRDSLVSGCIYAFFIAEDEFLPFLPLGHGARKVPVSVPACSNLPPAHVPS
jgi:hypothetical protein